MQKLKHYIVSIFFIYFREVCRFVYFHQQLGPENSNHPNTEGERCQNLESNRDWIFYGFFLLIIL